MSNPNDVKKAASEFSTHKTDCTCKGEHFSSDKYTGYLAGSAFQKDICAREIERLKLKNDKMFSALELIASYRDDYGLPDSGSLLADETIRNLNK